MRKRLFGALGLVAGIAVGCGLSTHYEVDPSQHAAGTELMINPNPIIITGLLGSSSFAPYTISGGGFGGSGYGGGSGYVTTMHIMSSTFSSQNPTCSGGGAACAFGPLNVLIPTTMATLHCVPAATPVVSSMTVTDDSNQTVMTQIECRTSAAINSFSVQNTLGRFGTPVGVPHNDTLVISNTGSGDIPIQVTVGPNFTSEWAFSQCVATPCNLPSTGTRQIAVPFTFTPLAHGPRDSDVTVSSTAAGVSSQVVSLLGTGNGASLRVDQPASPTFRHNFGTIAKGQTATFSIAMSNLGNESATVNLGSPLAAPFATTSTLPVTVSDMGGALDVTCSSPTPLAAQTAMVALDPSDNTYVTIPNPPRVEIECAVANTTLQITPALEFGEKRVGEPEGTIDLMFLNPPGGGTVTITRIALVNSPAALELGSISTTTINDGQTATARLSLKTTEEVDLTGVMLEVDVIEGEQVTLSLPVTGKVGRPDATVVPSRLDLGSVCIDSSPEGQITMANIGTSTLRVQPPTMDTASLVPLFTSPTSYPPGGATLLPGDDAIVGVRPEVGNTAGMFMATMLWDVDVPTTFMVPISLELRDEGTAVSPGELSFTATSIVDPVLARQTITLQNCGPDAAFVSYDHVVPSSGKANAWILEPASQQRELLAQETMRVHVSFSPREPGLYRANLELNVGDEKRNVALIGEGTGTLPEQTSFYACDCSGSSGPGRWTSWLIPLAALLVLRRRRRR